MRKGLLGSIAALAASAGLAWSQAPAQPMGGMPASLPVMQAQVQVDPLGAPVANGAAALANPNLIAPPQTDMSGPGGTPGFLCDRFYVNGEYLFYFVKNMPRTVPLVTTGPAPGVAGIGGTLGAPTTVTLFPTQDINFDPESGARWSIGYWFDFDTRWGWDFTGMVLGRYSQNYSVATGPQVLSRPFFNVFTGLGDATPVAAPLGNNTQSSGQINVNLNSQLWGFDSNMKWKLFGDWDRYFGVMLGYRFADLSESLNIATRRFGFRQGATADFFGQLFTAPGTLNEIDVTDFFGTHNVFQGGQVGFDFQYAYQRWLFSGYAKCGIGVTHEILNIQGNSALIPTAGATPNVAQGGLLATASNIGVSTLNQFAVMPEGNLQLGYRIARNFTISLGYDFEYLSRVIRPLDQVNINVNPNQVPTSFGVPPAGSTIVQNGSGFGLANGAPVNPVRTFTQSDFFAHGADVMLTFHY
ncbi:MAG TPA: BBP7 family outer membrane beta-barrel protein [Gemmataceae bacterium]|nr:BBP7 family outer membrane beta-barrel protein [Gemmataceae bacterium]